jgi:hypothetical protein
MLLCPLVFVADSLFLDCASHAPGAAAAVDGAAATATAAAAPPPPVVVAAPPPPVAVAAPQPSDDPVYDTYKRMQKVGLPSFVVAHKMRLDGLDPAVLGLE